MKKILVAEDNSMYSKALEEEITRKISCQVLLARNFREVKELYQSHKKELFAGIVNFDLPDAENGAAMSFMTEHKIPAILLTNSLDNAKRNQILKLHTMDYVLKRGIHSIERVLRALKRIERNRNTKVLIVDDSVTARVILSKYLTHQSLIVLEAEDGSSALAILKQNQDIKLIITDWEMPGMNGFELVTTIRESYPMDKLGIIGISAQETPPLSAGFLKRGANDFVTKPFVEEEFYWRVNQCIELLEYIEKARNAATKDYLTKLYNRRYLHEMGNKLFFNAKRENLNLTTAMVDIDHFKRINDTYGHDAGDLVLKVVGEILKESFRESDLVARYGGEEFCIITTNTAPEHRLELFEKLRTRVEEESIIYRSREIAITISIGVTGTIQDSLDETLNKADELLYRAKHSGRNCVRLD